MTTSGHRTGASNPLRRDLRARLRRLAVALARPLTERRTDRPPAVLEVGAGTGAVSRVPAERLGAEDTQDWTERVQYIVGTYVRERGRPMERLDREDRLMVLARLDEAGVFAVRRAAPFVADALKGIPFHRLRPARRAPAGWMRARG